MANRNKDSGFVDNWQAGKTVTECNLHMLTTAACSDVIFRVGSEKHVVRAHRYVLASRSCVFHAMFFGPLAEKGDVTIPDIEPYIFNEFLRHLYTDKSNITPDNVTGLLYTSRKYFLDSLLDQCEIFLENSMSEKNVCHILENCHGYFIGKDFEQKALKILTGAGEKVIKSPGFLTLNKIYLKEFLKSDQLTIKEEDIFEAIHSWAKRKCEEADLPVIYENILGVLGDMVYDIRFPLMSPSFLEKDVREAQILSVHEINTVIENIGKPNVHDKFNSERRQTKSSLPNTYVTRFQNCTFRPYSFGDHAITFSVSKDTNLVGCQLYGPYTHPEHQYNVSLTLVDTRGNVIAQPVQDRRITLRGEGSVNDILFPGAISLEAASPYTLCANLTGPSTWWGIEGQQSVHVDGVTFTFTNPLDETGETSVSEGQIPGLIFSVIQ